MTKLADARYFTLWFPRPQRIHKEQTFRAAVSFDELWELSLKSRQTLTEDGFEDKERWITRLKGGNPESDSPGRWIRMGRLYHGRGLFKRLDPTIAVRIETTEQAERTNASPPSSNDIVFPFLKWKLCDRFTQ